MPRLRLILLILVCALVAGLAAGVLYQFSQKQAPANRPATAGKPPVPASLERKKAQQLTPTQRLAATRRLVEEQMARAPEYGKFFSQLKSTFPAANKRILDGFADAVGKGTKLEIPDFYPAQALSGLRSSHGILAANASPEALNRVYDLRASVLRALAASDPKLCADFLYGATSADFFRFSAANRKLIAAMMEADLGAIIDGGKSKIERPVLEAAEIKQLEDVLRGKKLEKPEIDMLLDARMPDPPLADATVCRAGQAYYDALRDLPEDVRMKIYAQSLKLLART